MTERTGKYFYILWIMALLAGLSGCAARAGWSVVGYGAPDDKSIRQKKETLAITEKQIGYMMIDINSGAVLARQNADKPFIPASTIKAVTALMALDKLGPDARFQTSVYGTGRVEKDILAGDLYLSGGGDAMLSVKDLYTLAFQLKDKGIRTISGKLYYGGGALKARSMINENQPADAAYNTAVNGLSLDFNRRLLNWKKNDGKIYAAWNAFHDGADVLAVDENLPSAMFAENKAPGMGQWMASKQTLADGGQKMLPVRNPAAWTATVFRQIAKNIGLELPRPEPVRAKMLTKQNFLARIQSPPLTDIMKPWLRYSNNLMAELIGLRTALKTGKSAKQADVVLKSWLREKWPGMDWQAFYSPNYSGLSVKSRTTPVQMAMLMKSVWGWRFDGRPFMALLPVSGWQKSFQNRFTGPLSAGRVIAKTGTMNYASAMVGYLLTDKGRQLAFALNITDFEKRRKYDRLDETARRALSAEAHQWRLNAKLLEQDIIENWLIKF